MLLPNRNLDYGYVKLDGNVVYRLTPRLSLFTQMDNLLNNQHIGPIGYPGLPFTVRAGIKYRIGRETKGDVAAVGRTATKAAGAWWM